MKWRLRGVLGLHRAGRGARPYSTFPGSLWDCGILPCDTLDLLAAERGGYVRARPLIAPRLGRAARAHPAPRHAQFNCIAIAPTATIANIVGVSASIERLSRTCS